MRNLTKISIGIIALLLVLSTAGMASVIEQNPTTVSYTLYRYNERRSGQVPFAGEITNPQIRWTYDRPPAVLTSPMVADINNDGENEVVFGGTDGKVTALTENGNFIWEVQLEVITAAGTVGDLDGDEMPELIVTELWHLKTGGQSIIVLNGEDGSEVWRFTPVGFSEQGFASSPILRDITGDGILDLLVGSMTYKYYALNGLDGSVIWSSDFEHFIRSPSPISDIDLDGREEVVGIDNHALVKIMDVETGAVEWTGYTGYCVGSTPNIGDLDGDGYGEIVFSMCIDGGTLVLNHDGTPLWQRNNGTRFYSSAALVDIDGDGLEDVVNTDVLTWTVNAYKGTNGVTLWNTILPNTTWAQGSPVSVDIDGDEVIEIVVGSDAGLYSLNSLNGDLEWFFPTGKVRGEPFIVDLEKEGGTEIVYNSGPTVYVVEQVYEPPVSVIDIYRNVYVCMRVEGRRTNTVTATFQEDGMPIGTLSITRIPNSPNTQMQCMNLKIRDGKNYSVVLRFTSMGIGANPVDMIMEAGKGKRIKVIFNSENGKAQEVTESLNDELAKILDGSREYIFDGSNSYDPDGYIVSYYWNFGDGKFAYGELLKHEYLIPGLYTVVLEVKDNKNKFGSASTQLIVS